MTSEEQARIERRLHDLEVRLLDRLGGVSARIEAALALRSRVDDHEQRLRAIEHVRRPSWRDVGALVLLLVALIGFMHGWEW